MHQHLTDIQQRNKLPKARKSPLDQKQRAKNIKAYEVIIWKKNDWLAVISQQRLEFTSCSSNLENIFHEFRGWGCEISIKSLWLDYLPVVFTKRYFQKFASSWNWIFFCFCILIGIAVGIRECLCSYGKAFPNYLSGKSPNSPWNNFWVNCWKLALYQSNHDFELWRFLKLTWIRLISCITFSRQASGTVQL